MQAGPIFFIFTREESVLFRFISLFVAACKQTSRSESDYTYMYVSINVFVRILIILFKFWMITERNIF